MPILWYTKWDYWFLNNIIKHVQCLYTNRYRSLQLKTVIKNRRCSGLSQYSSTISYEIQINLKIAKVSLIRWIWWLIAFSCHNNNSMLFRSVEVFFRSLKIIFCFVSSKDGIVQFIVFDLLSRTIHNTNVITLVPHKSMFKQCLMIYENNAWSFKCECPFLMGNALKDTGHYW